MQRRSTTILLGMAVIALSRGTAGAAAIDLSKFFADPTVTVASDGSSAIFREDPTLGSVLLANDPGLGDPVIILASMGAYLTLDFEFSEGTNEHDEFAVLILDATTGASVGGAFEAFVSESTIGTLAFDLSSLVGRTLGLQFQLTSLPGDTGLASEARISSVTLTSVVAEPAAGLLIGIAVLSLVFYRSLARSR